MTSCAAAVQSPVSGYLYTSIKAPQAVTSNSLGTRVGSGEATTILGLIATGDVSIQTIAQKAGIKRVSHVDYESTSILGIFGKVTMYVYGE